MKLIPNVSSKLFQPVNIIPKNSVVKNNLLPKNQKLLLNNGFIRHANNGVYHYLPLGLRVIKKLNKIIDKHMKEISAQKLQLSSLTEGELWKKSGRWNVEKMELFKIKDRHNKDFLLSPTHEESITGMISNIPPLTYKCLPLLLYQISNKFRDEIKPRCGLIRSKEFIMKDLYSFDDSFENANHSYRRVIGAYNKIFEEIGVPVIFARGSSGEMGGDLSHEFHILTDIGEDEIKICPSCNDSVNAELSDGPDCPNCGAKNCKLEKGVEVGHTFLLGTKYSKALGAMCTSETNKKVPLVMGSYGLGVSRIVAACVESLSLEDEIRWPTSIAPYSVIIIPPKEGSKEYSEGIRIAFSLYEKLNSELDDDILLDDRPGMTIGKKILDSRKTGYPHVVVVGSKALETQSLVELHCLNSDKMDLLTIPEMLKFFSQFQNEKSRIAN